MIPLPRLKGAFCLLVGLVPLSGAAGRAQTPNPRGPLATTFEEAEARMVPFNGRRASNPVDPSTTDRKVFVGYQGWFFTPDDGSGLGWRHYGGPDFKPGTATVEMWPDMSEATPGEKYPTDFRNPDGSVATVFSSYNPYTVNRHFRWMADYGIDGAFIQRFATDLRGPQGWDKVNTVLDYCRRAANANGRTWAVMYDLSGLDENELMPLLTKDWKALVDRMKINKDPAYQRHTGKPLVIIWGVGFTGDKRKYTLAECSAFIDFLKKDSVYGGNTVMLGIPSNWCNPDNNSPSPEFKAVLLKADIISPWNVGSYKNIEGFKNRLQKNGRSDLAWIREHKLGYMPVIFPGFGWKNLMTTRDNAEAAKAVAPRGDGSFFWNQGAGWLKEGASMLYVAMFDEIDEGTAIFKTSTTPPPPGESTFISNAPMPPDHYLWLTGQLSKALKSGLKPPMDLPSR